MNPTNAFLRIILNRVRGETLLPSQARQQIAAEIQRQRKDAVSEIGRNFAERFAAEADATAAYIAEFYAD